MSNIDITAVPDCGLTIQTINSTECIGDSLSKIQGNFDAIVTSFSNNCSALEETITAVETINQAPVGTIMMWTGQVSVATASIVNGAEVYIKPGGVTDNSWAVCTGATIGSVTTPDLIGRFVVGAGNPPTDSTFTSTTQYDVNDTGGVEDVTLTPAQLPTHTHTPTVVTSVVLNKDRHASAVTGPGDFLTGTTSLGVSTGTIGGGGSDQSHANRPPYYAIYYIMRVS